jgi:hypothetical protein
MVSTNKKLLSISQNFIIVATMKNHKTNISIKALGIFFSPKNMIDQRRFNVS